MRKLLLSLLVAGTFCVSATVSDATAAMPSHGAMVGLAGFGYSSAAPSNYVVKVAARKTSVQTANKSAVQSAQCCSGSNGGKPADYNKFVRLVKGQISRH